MSKSPTTDVQLARAARGVKNFRGVFLINELPAKPWVNESGIVNFGRDRGTHWTSYNKRGRDVEYFDSFGAVPPPPELVRYFKGCELTYNALAHQTYDQQNCGQLSVRFLLGQLRNTTHRIT